MSEENGQGSGTQEEEKTGTENETENNGAGGENEGTENDDKGTENKDADVVPKSEFEKLFARMQAADRAKNAAEAKLREKEQAEMSETERTKAQLAEATKKAEEAQNRLKTTLIENAFHRENKIVWHDVSDAIAALDMSGVEITEDGKVTGMAAAIKDVAKRKPHYVKQGEGTQPPAANGASNGQRRGEKGETPDRKALIARFPALGK